MCSKTAHDAGLSRGARPRSLAIRLTFWCSLISFVMVLLATGFLYWALAAYLERENDHVLADQMLPVINLLQEQPLDVPALRRQVQLGKLAHEAPTIYMRVLDSRQLVIADTPSMDLVFPRSDFPPPAPYHRHDLRGKTVPADQRWYRIVAAETTAPPGTAFTIHAALERTHDEEVLADCRRNLWLVAGVALLACSAGGYGAARRGLRPVHAIAETARRIRSSTLDQRIDLADVPAELRDLTDGFNEMLVRLQTSFVRLNEVAADMAHELRTPINNLRGEAEVALCTPRTAERYQQILASALEEYQRLSRLIDSLLFLARADNPDGELERETVDVVRELEQLREFYEPAAMEGDVRLTVCCAGLVTARVNRALFQRAVSNLISNALRHTPAQGSITITAARHDGRLHIGVADTGQGIAARHLPRLFDRFYRVDGTGAAGGNVGLGLAIVKSIALLHGGSVSIASTPGAGTQVTLILS